MLHYGHVAVQYSANAEKNLYGGQNFVEEQPSLRFWFVTQIT